MYLPVVRTEDGALARLTMVPFQVRNFRLNRASWQDTVWLHSTLDRESRRFGGRVELDAAGSLRLEWP